MHARLLDVFHHPADQRQGRRLGALDHRGSRAFVRFKVGDHVHVDLDGIAEKTIDEHRRIVKIARTDRGHHVPTKRCLVVTGLHPTATQDVTRPHQNRVTNPGGDADGIFERMGDAVLWLLEPKFVEHGLEAIAIFREIDRIQARSDQRHARGDQAVRQVQRCLATVLHHAPDHASRSPGDINATTIEPLYDIQHVLKRERFKEELVAGVVIG